jgi:hypothetical protein
LTHFANICQIEGSEREWRQWYEKERPEEEEIPCGYQKSLDVFRRLLLIRSWSPDRTLSQARHYVMSINIFFFPWLSLEICICEFHRFAGARVRGGVHPGPGGHLGRVGAAHAPRLHALHRLGPLAADRRPRQTQGHQ